LAANLKRCGVAPEAISDVFLTHCDFDHSGGLPALSRARRHMGARELPVSCGNVARMGRLLRSRNEVPCANLLADGQRLRVGSIDVEAISVPGHTPGSVAYLVAGKYLFTGDALMLVDGRAGQFVPWLTMDRGAAEESIRRLAAVAGVEAVFTAHTGWTADPQKTFALWR
jgi:glyoxylase-like metal-dependent hydrolase (beta-lactamase superfamily II)